jgi:hypothetical protein
MPEIALGRICRVASAKERMIGNAQASLGKAFRMAFRKCFRRGFSLPEEKTSNRFEAGSTGTNGA